MKKNKGIISLLRSLIQKIYLYFTINSLVRFAHSIRLFGEIFIYFFHSFPTAGNNSFIFFHRGNNNIIPYGSLPDKGSFLLIFCKNSDQKRQKTRKNRENRPFSVFGKVARFYSELSVEIASKADFPSLEIVDVYVSTVGMGSNSISISTDGYSTRSVD